MSGETQPTSDEYCTNDEFKFMTFDSSGLKGNGYVEPIHINGKLDEMGYSQYFIEFWESPMKLVNKNTNEVIIDNIPNAVWLIPIDYYYSTILPWLRTLSSNQE